MAKAKQRRSPGRPRRHPPFGATKKTGEQNARQRDRANIDFLIGEVDKLRGRVQEIELRVDDNVKRLLELAPGVP